MEGSGYVSMWMRSNFTIILMIVTWPYATAYRKQEHMSVYSSTWRKPHFTARLMIIMWHYTTGGGGGWWRKGGARRCGRTRRRAPRGKAESPRVVFRRETAGQKPSPPRALFTFLSEPVQVNTKWTSFVYKHTASAPGPLVGGHTGLKF